jgi:hypothetical protein
MDDQTLPITPQSQGPQNPPANLSINPTPVPSSPLGQPTVGMPNIDTQGPVVMGGYNNSQKVPESYHLNLWVIIGGILILMLVISAVLYLWILPSLWTNSYLKNIRPLYQKQVSQMTVVYQSIGRPVFTSDNTTVASDNQDFQYITGVLQTAINNTNALEAKDHLTILPGTTWEHTVSKVNSECWAMQQYVPDSQIFLKDYKTLVIYAEQIDQIGQVQMPTLINNIGIINQGTTSESVFITDLQNTITNLQSFIDQIKGLKPPADLQGYNQGLLIDLSGMNNSLQTEESDLQNNNYTGFESQQAIYASSLNDFVKLLDSHPAANLQSNSIIHSQITNLKGENPLQ